MAAMAAVSMGGMYICSRVRPCTAIKSAPFASQLLGDLDAGQVVGIPADAHFDGQRRIIAQRFARGGDHRPQSGGSSSSLLPRRCR